MYVSFWALHSFGAPHPGTSTSLLTDPEKGLFMAPLGFTVKTEGTGWVPKTRPQTPIFESFRYAPKIDKDSDAFMSVRSDKLADKMSLEVYAKKWLRDYPQFGFELLGTKAIQIQKSPALVIDFIQKEKNRQIRQVIVQSGAKLAVFTCTDKKTEFSKTLATCNKIIRSFEWEGN